MRKLLLVFLVLAAMFVTGCKDESKSIAEVVRPVKTMTVAGFGDGKQWSFTGTAEDALESVQSFRVSGKLIYFPGDQIGKKFREGEVIAKLDPSDYELEVRQREAQLEQIRANFVRATADVKRIRELYERRVVSKSELDQSVADFKSFKANRNAAEKQLDIARKQLRYTVLKAPFSGWVSRTMVKIHQNVQSGQGIVALNAGKQMKMTISIPDTLISSIEDGEKVEVTFDALPGKKFEGKIMEVGVGTDSGSTYPVKVYLDNSQKLVRSGMPGNVSLLNEFDSQKTVVYVEPFSVVGETDGSHTVWIVDPQKSTVSRRKVKVGDLTPKGLEIIEGVSPGDIVVTRGVHSLKEGMKVRLGGGVS